MSQLNVAKALNQALALHQSNQPAKAERLFRQILAQQPNNVDALNLLGALCTQTGRFAEAVLLLNRALSINPNFPLARYNLGNSHLSLGQIEQAIAAYKEALAMKPAYPETLCFLGLALIKANRLAEAQEMLQKALALRPKFMEACKYLGDVFFFRGGHDLSLDCHQRALAISDQDPNLRLSPFRAEIYNAMGHIQKDAGRLDEALTALRKALAVKPDYTLAHSNYVNLMHFHAKYDAHALLEAHREWDRQQAAPLAWQIKPFSNDPNPDRRVRIGYVSPDFCSHVVGRFMVTLISNHDHRAFEIFCYSDVTRADAITERTRQSTDAWRDTAAMTHEQVADLIRRDQIDILVDLTMHQNKNRLLVFARKPAPVQATYLAYCSTTGMATMDYRITDPYLDPQGMDESCYTEKTMRLPETYWCYEPLPYTPEVAPPPCAEKGHVTFGSMNNFCKVSDGSLETWARLMQEVPDARLLIHCVEGAHRQRVMSVFEKHAIAAERVEFVGKVSLPEYFPIYHQIDIALDPFPYAGGTTTCDALWMGVPVVTLRGNTAVGRGGVSILSNMGMTDLIADSTEAYIRIAGELARDLPRLSELRATLRQRMQASPLMDEPRFARNLEALYREMWRQWCSRVPSSPTPAVP